MNMSEFFRYIQSWRSHVYVQCGLEIPPFFSTIDGRYINLLRILVGYKVVGIGIFAWKYIGVLKNITENTPPGTQKRSFSTKVFVHIDIVWISSPGA